MKKIILVSMGLPIGIRNTEGKKATIELNKDDFVVCRYHPNNSVYLHDANLINWYPRRWIKRLEHAVKVWLRKKNL